MPVVRGGIDDGRIARGRDHVVAPPQIAVEHRGIGRSGQPLRQASVERLQRRGPGTAPPPLGPRPFYLRRQSRLPEKRWPVVRPRIQLWGAPNEVVLPEAVRRGCVAVELRQPFPKPLPEAAALPPGVHPFQDEKSGARVCRRGGVSHGRHTQRAVGVGQGAQPRRFARKGTRHRFVAVLQKQRAPVRVQPTGRGNAPAADRRGRFDGHVQAGFQRLAKRLRQHRGVWACDGKCVRWRVPRNDEGR